MHRFYAHQCCNLALKEINESLARKNVFPSCVVNKLPKLSGTPAESVKMSHSIHPSCPFLPLSPEIQILTNCYKGWLEDIAVCLFLCFNYFFKNVVSTVYKNLSLAKCWDLQTLWRLNMLCP